MVVKRTHHQILVFFKRKIVVESVSVADTQIIGHKNVHNVKMFRWKTGSIGMEYSFITNKSETETGKKESEGVAQQEKNYHSSTWVNWCGLKLHLQKKKISASGVLLDSGSIISLFKDKQLVINIRKAKQELVLD